MHRGERKSGSGVYWTLLLSLLLHLAALLYKMNTRLHTSTAPIPDALIELSEIPPSLEPSQESKPPKTAKNQVVETEDANNREMDPNASLLSDKNQRAEKDTKAAVTNDFKKGTGSGNDQLGNNMGEETQNDSISIGENPTKKDWRSLSLKDLSVGTGEGPLSASDDYLPHVEAGERTILSTREFRYFSYYNRIKDLLRQFWKPSIEREVAKLWGKGQMLKENELTTRVLVLLDKQGQIQKISKVGASGISEVDEAAVQAFYQAAPFPNPPAGLVDTDGFVRINWDFILQTAAAPRIQYRPAGPRGFR